VEKEVVTYAVRFPADVAARIEANAEEEGTTTSDVIHRLVGKALRHDVRVMAYHRRAGRSR
jgi:predicted DNA-binding protein